MGLQSDPIDPTKTRLWLSLAFEYLLEAVTVGLYFVCLNLKMPGRKETAILPLFKDVVGGDFKTPRVECIFAVQLWPRMALK